MKGFIVVLLAMVFSLLAANETVLEKGTPTGYTIGTETDDYLDLNFSVGSIFYSDVATEKGTFTSVTIENGYLTRDEGSPALPSFRQLIAMPYGADPQVEVISYESKSYKLSAMGITKPIMPAQPSYSKSAKPEEIKFIYNENAYRASKFNEEIIAEVSKSGTMRGIGVGSVVINPFRYNPSTGEILVYNNIKVRISYTGADQRALQIAEEEYSPFFEQSYSSMINYKPSDTKADLMKYPVTYLILANSGLNGNAKLNEFIAWKTQKGFKVVVNYVSASSTITTNDSWIENQYNSLTPKPSFVLVIGDHDGTYGVLAEVNPSIGSGGSVTRSDLLYGVIGATSSSNRIPSMYVGRFSVRALTDLTAQVDKTIWYEKGQFAVTTPDLNYLTYTLGVAGVDAANSAPYGDPQISYGWTHYFNSAHGMANSKTYLSATSGASTTDAAVVSYISAGAGFYNYTAHGSETSFGDPTFTISNIDALANANEYPLVVGNCCLTGSFGTTECFGEAWLNAANKGGIGYIGASMSTYWDEDLCMGVGLNAKNQVPPPLDITKPGMYDGAMSLGYSSQAAIKHVGLMAVETYGGSKVDWYWSAYHLFGDPALMPYFGIPAAQTATHAGSINAGATTYSVTTTAYAYVALSDQNGVLHGTARANSSGVASVTVTPYLVGDTGKLVITNQFKRPYFADITVGGTPTVPGIPTLATPSNASSTTDLTPTFDWNDVSGATSYTILADNNSDFTSNEINQTVTSSTYTPASNLAAGTYYWKVKATNATGSSAYTSAWTVVLQTVTAVTLPVTADFTVAALPSGWTNADNQGGGQVWQFGTHASGMTTSGNYAYLNSDAYGSGKTQNADLITPLINCTGATNVTLAFSHYFKSYTGSSATLSYSVNGGSTWTVIQSWTVTTTNPVSFSQIVTAVAGQAQVKFKWNYTGTYGYYWDVDNISITSGTTPTVPSVPTLATPANASSTTDLTPTFDWNDVSGATSYTILVDNNSDFLSNEINQVPTASTYTPAANLAVGTYYWKVRATNANGSSAYTSAWTVTLTAAPTVPSVPTLATPANASSTTDLTPTFDWNDVSGATSYTILVDNNSDFLSNEINQVPTASTYTPTANLAAGTYYWKVKATNAAGSSAYTSAWTVVLQTSGGVTLPFSENFATSSIPADWSQVNTSGVTNRWTASNTNIAGGTAYEMKAAYQQINPGTARFVTPPVNTTGCSSLNFSFRHMLDAYAAGVTLRIQSSTDKINWTNESWSVATSSSNIPAAVVNTTVNNNLGNITYIAFVFTGDLYQIDYWYIDNVSVTSGTAPTVPAVPTLATPANASSTTDLTPTFDWNDVSGATSYTILADNNADFTSNEINQTVTSSTYTPASNLAAGTYYWKVKATNATGSSAYTTAWSVILSTGSTQTTLLSTNFPSTSLPTGWSIVDNVGAGQVWKIGTHTSGLGGTPVNYAYLNSDAFGSGKTQNSDLITPVINCSGKTSITLTFKHYFKFYTGSSAKLYYSINGGSTWTQIQAWTASTANPATFTQVITAVAGQASVKFKWNYTGTWGYYWDVDDITVTGLASAALPAPGVPAKVVSNVLETKEGGLNLVIDWDIAENATSYDVYSSDDPYGTFTLETNVVVNQYVTEFSSSKKFYYIIAKN